MNASQAINNLELISAALEKAANAPQNYNSEFAFHLERMSWEMHKQANELKALTHFFDAPYLDLNA